MKIARLSINLNLYVASISAILFVFEVTKIHNLRLISVNVPSAVMNFSQVVLVCNYDLQDDQLYSVKWYKNYVEFYRFQPNNLESLSVMQQGQGKDQAAEFQSKQVFELEGIDPDLPKCNSTHVYLKQVSFSTEGTFKCEVSADSPSFATVSIERQLKVYVLPKQKLSITDNLQFKTNSKQMEFPHLKSKQSSISNSYALNDFINLTCSSGFSKPAAKLTWFINDKPVISSSNSLTHYSIEMITLEQQRLVESKLSLAFTIGLEHLFSKNMYDWEKNGLQRQSYSKFLYENNLRPLKLRCVSRLVVDFTSEAEIFVLNGKSSVKRGRNLVEGQRRDMFKFVEDSNSNSNNKSKSNNASANIDPVGNFEEYRWPVNSGKTRRKTKIKSDDEHHFWTLAMTETSDQEQLNTELHYDKISIPNHQVGSNLIVWTNKQLKSQADFIEQKLLNVHSNELEAPKITAHTQFSDIILDTTIKAAQNDRTLKETSNSSDRINESPIQSENYQPNDVVKFTCSPRYVSPQKVEVIMRVFTRWLINNKEITSKYINAFNGTSFLFDESLNKRRKILLSNDDGIENHLTIQFTTSLFQLKELNLKCKTIVEQQLIEFENELTLNVLIGHRFIKQDTKFSKRKQIVGKGDGMKRGRNMVKWPVDNSSSSFSFQSSLPLFYTVPLNLLTTLFVLISHYQ